VRRFVKHLVERSIRFSGAPALSRRRHARDILVLAYHNIVPDGEPAAGDRSLHLPQRAFARQLDLLQRTHDVVPLSAIIDSPGTSRGRRPRAVITFDDAYRGTMTAGVAELRRRKLPATVFVAPAFVGGGTFWWDLLTPPGACPLDPELRETALTTDAGQHTRILERAREKGHPTTTSLPVNATCATVADLEAALAHDGLTYGSHTWSHPNLTQLAPKDLANELSAPAEWLRRYDGHVVPAIAYPYGCANEVVWQAAERAGYRAGFMIDGGWVTRPLDGPSDARYALPRLNIPAGVSPDGFALRAAGVITA